VYSAHYDHLGVAQDGRVYNGADDDASGTSMVMALAEAITRLPRKPSRSAVFLCVTGEEKGLLGSSYYADHPAIGLNNTVCDLNINMIGRTDPEHDKLRERDYTYVIGSDKISADLDRILRAQNDRTVKLKLDYKYNDENDPERFYYRSDHYNFARRGVPVIFFFTGTHGDYHRTTDDFEKIDFDQMAKIGNLIYAVGTNVANRKERLKPTQPPKH